MFLIVVADMHLAAKFHTARIRALQLIDDLEDRRLTGTIIADDRHFLTAVDLKTDIRKKWIARERF